MESVVLTRDQILEAEDLTLKRVEVPEWGGDVFVRTLSAGQLEDLQARIKDNEGGELTDTELVAYVVAETCCNGKGALYFTREDTDALMGKSPKLLTRVGDEAMNLNLLTMGSRDDAEGE